MNLYFTALFKFVLSIYFLETLRVCYGYGGFNYGWYTGAPGGRGVRGSVTYLRKAYTRV